MLGVPLQMANHKRLLSVMKYLCEKAEDPNAEFQFEVSDSSDAAGNRAVTIKVQSRVPPGAAEAILKGYDDAGSLAGHGTIKNVPASRGDK